MPLTLQTGYTFADGDVVTPNKLNNAVNLATVASGSLAVANGGTGATTASTARENLGIGTVATQDADSVAVTGGTLTGVAINNSAIGGTTPAAGAFTTLAASGAFSLAGDQVQVSEGGTGASTVAGARTALSFDSLRTVTYASSVALDFAHLEDLKTVTLTGNISLTTTNRTAGRTYLLRIVGDGSSRTITVSSSWKFYGRQPTTNTFTVGANKEAMLGLQCYGTAETDVRGVFLVQP